MKFKTGRYKVEFKRDKKGKIIYRPTGIGWKEIKEGDEIESMVVMEDCHYGSLSVKTIVYRNGNKMDIDISNTQGVYCNIVDRLKLTEIPTNQHFLLDFIKQ